MDHETIIKQTEIEEVYKNKINGTTEKKIRNEHSSNGSCTGNLATDILLSGKILDKFYHSYSLKQRRPAIDWFLVASILFNLWVDVVPQGQTFIGLTTTGVILSVNILVLIFLRIAGSGKFRKFTWELVSYIVWLLAVIQFVIYLVFKLSVTPRDCLGWAILINFLVYVTLPVPFFYSGIIMGVGFISIYLAAIIELSLNDPYFWRQITANLILILASQSVGFLYYVLGEAKQKRAFQEAKKSLEVKMVIEEETAEQERLLLSVLPEHVAVKMRQDLGSTDSEQFKKIYMSRHENVSILYADIVGFTAISSTYSAQDLVKMLNELFARFDRLAEKYHQLRIKILGDCYYCISGAPVERPDHAVLCVHMGLSMVKAIKYVQQKTNSPVDMRVGIHTGAVLAGILGQRQWQFDVYSKDVELANKMESSGKAGRVHISEKTLGFLNGEFEVEPAYGERREEALRIAGLKTFFIIKVLKPFGQNGEQSKNGDSHSESTKPRSIGLIGEINSVETSPDDDLKANSGDEDAKADMDRAKEEDFKQRLETELISRNGHRELSKDTNWMLNFKDSQLECSYIKHREPYSSVPLITSLFVQIVNIIYSGFILPITGSHFAIIAGPLVLIALLAFISVSESFPMVFPAQIIRVSKKFNDIHLLRISAAFLIIILLAATNIVDMLLYSNLDPIKLQNFTNNTYHDKNGNSPSYIPPLYLLLYPSYLGNFCVLILISIAVIAQLTHLCKILCMLLVTALHCIMSIIVLEEHFEYEENEMWNTGLPTRYNISIVLFAVTIALSFLARHMDKEDRVIFKWKTEVADQKEKVSDMRRRNEALVYNILPVHVAEHFMKNTKRSHDDLYSQSYAEVGVLFASMPNFSDFYSEESVNNQGLECLRFLNEVISDYDALLELPQFQDVIKIKTIGSTYMAASGLNPSRIVKEDDPIMIRWAHLSLLVEFALELKKALQGINEQSFNHFVLKMGINHGPITAGVIGARKPHYDIWGNTVNVASRMESTGKAGAIQVTEETCQILQTFGYTFEQRGLVSVKGKGQLMTYYLQGKANRSSLTPSPMLTIVNTMETLPEVDEPSDSPRLLNSRSNNKEIISLNGNNVGIRKNSFQSINSPSLTSPNRIEHNNGLNKESLDIVGRLVDNDSQNLDNINNLSPVKHNGVNNSELELDIDVKTPLLNSTKTKKDTNEKESLILSK